MLYFRIVDKSSLLIIVLLYHLVLFIYLILFFAMFIYMYLHRPQNTFPPNQDWAKEAGYTTEEIRQNAKEINLIKKQRAVSRKSKGLRVLYDLREWLRRPLAKAKPSCLHRSSIRVAKEAKGHTGTTTLDPLDTPSNSSIQSRIQLSLPD